MASPSKRLHLALETPDTTESSSNSDDDSEDPDNSTTDDPEEIQVEFEARTPEECDFHGIKGLLTKMFRLGGAGGANSPVDVSGLAEFIIGQRNVGSVITQSHGSSDSDDEFDDMDNEVFGVTTVLKLTGESALAAQVKEYLVRVAKKHEALTAFLANPNHSLGFLISERIMNIPPQISVPLYETLFNEIRKARAKNCPFDFTHFVLISKCLRSSAAAAPAGGVNGVSPVVFVNAEEEMFEEESELVVDVENQQGGGEGGENAPKVFDLSESEYESSAKIMIINAGKSERILSLLKNLFPL